MLAAKMLTLTDEELMNVMRQACLDFKAAPTTKKEAVAKQVWLAASAEATLRLLRATFAARAATGK